MFHRLQYFFVPYLHHVSPTGPVFPGHAVDVQALIELIPALPGQGETVNAGHINVSEDGQQ